LGSACDLFRELRLADRRSHRPRFIRVSEVKLLGSARTRDWSYLDKQSGSVASLLIDMPLAPRFRQGPRVIEYRQLLRDLHDAEHGASDAIRRRATATLDNHVKGKLVFVGLQLEDGDHYGLRGWEGGKIWGSELHAHAIETLFSGRAVRVLSDWAHLALLAGFAATAALARLRFRRDFVKRRLSLAALLGASAALVFVLAVYLDLLMDGAYLMVAVVLSYWISRKYIPQWSAHVPTQAPD
jgi:hypothetical protein